MFVPFRSGNFWLLAIDADFVSVDDKLESFMTRDPTVKMKRIQVFGESETETEVESESDSPKPVLQIGEVFHAQALDKFVNRFVAFVDVVKGSII